MNRGEVLVDLTKAVAAHMRWKMRLYQCIHGQAELPRVAEVARDDACELGQWLISKGMVYKDFESFSGAKGAHAAFHLCAAEVVSAVERGEKSAAEGMLQSGSAFALASEAVSLALTKLRAEVARAGKRSVGL